MILENNLIKKYNPKYNINLKDSKSYAFIEISDEKFLRLLVARKRESRGKFYGPFVSGMSRDCILKALRKIFKIRTCKKLPSKKCMRFDIRLCSGPCEKIISSIEYLQNIKDAEMVLKGKTHIVTEILNKKMKEFSANQNFERALEVREQVRTIIKLSERRKMERNKNYDEDFINWIVVGEHAYLILFNARKGILEINSFLNLNGVLAFWKNS